jgi:amino acid permease
MSKEIETKKSRLGEISVHPFQILHPDTHLEFHETGSKEIISTVSQLDKRSKKDSDLVPIRNSYEPKKKASIISAGLLMTSSCLGTTIFTFAIKAKSFGLIWLVVATIVVGIINYWTIMAGAKASSKCKEDNYSEITQKILGRKVRVILNCFLVLNSYSCMMCCLALLYPLFGRFILSIAYNDKYSSYDVFSAEKWGKLYIKIPFYIGVSLAISLMCLIDDINKLSFSSYIGVSSVLYTLLVVACQCHGYYKYYKKTQYIEEDKSTHPNWTDLGQAFKKDLVFFKGMANLFCAYACHPNIFPVYKGFKREKEDRKEGLKKMSHGTIVSVILTTGIHILSMVCSFLTNPITPEDLIIFRQSKDGGKDIFMAIAKLVMFVSLIFTLPFYYFSLRLSIADSFLKGKITSKFNMIFTFCSVYGCAIIAIIYDKILSYLSYIGGFICVFICYLIPVLLSIKSSGKSMTYWSNLIQIILAIILCIIGVTAGILTIIDDVSG